MLHSKSWAKVGVALAVAMCLFSPAPARAAAVVKYAFMYIYQPPGGAWQLHGGHTFSSTGSVSFSRIGVGDYQFTLAAMPAFGNAHARSHGGNNRCKVLAWGPSGSDTVIRVRCTTPAGLPVDDLTVVQYYHAAGTDSLQTAYLWADSPAAPSYTPSLLYSYNSSGGVNQIMHGVEAGEYLAVLPGMTARGGDPHVTAYGVGIGDHCKVTTWYQGSGCTYVGVRCFKATGEPLDAYWTLRYTHGHVADDGRGLGGYALGNDDWGPGTPLHSYTPNVAFQFHTSGVTMIADNDLRSQLHMHGPRAI